jgi:hypothetical protein
MELLKNVEQTVERELARETEALEETPSITNVT